METALNFEFEIQILLVFFYKCWLYEWGGGAKHTLLTLWRGMLGPRYTYEKTRWWFFVGTNWFWMPISNHCRNAYLTTYALQFGYYNYSYHLNLYYCGKCTQKRGLLIFRYLQNTDLAPFKSDCGRFTRSAFKLSKRQKIK